MPTRVSSPVAADPRRPGRFALLGVALAAVVATIVVLTLITGGEETGTPLSPIAQAAERTANYPGARMAMRGIAEYPDSGMRMTMTGGGVFNGESNRARIELAAHMDGAPPGFQDFELVMVGEGMTMYMSSPLFTGELPDGKAWMKVEVGSEELEEAQALGQGDPRQQLDALRAVSGDVATVGQERVRGASTVHYTATLDYRRYADLLRDEGLDEAAEEIEQATEVTGDTMPVEVWIDEQGRVRRFDQVVSMASPGVPESHLRMSVEIYDFGIRPQIELPPEDHVFDATELAEQALEEAGA
jgi:hypothetical protein